MSQVAAKKAKESSARAKGPSVAQTTNLRVAVEEQVADEAAMEEDNAKGGAADEVRENAEEQVAGAVEQMVPAKQNEAVVSAADQELAEDVIS
ncbi:unnamed protein product [Prunus brigantina]